MRAKVLRGCRREYRISQCTSQLDVVSGLPSSLDTSSEDDPQNDWRDCCSEEGKAQDVTVG